MMDKKDIKQFYVYGTQLTSFRALIEATTAEEAEKLSLDGDYDWTEVGELGWRDNFDMTEVAE